MRATRLQEFIKGRRLHLGMSQDYVAGLLNISSRSYGNWERGVVKEWTDDKLDALSRVLDMTVYQRARLFWLATGRAPGRAAHTGKTGGPDTSAFLRDYRIMINALSLPSFVIDRAWNVLMANSAYCELFRSVRACPAAMPTQNFLRFGLFHPDAAEFFVDHLHWQLSMLAQLSSSLERHGEDPGLQAIRREVYLRPALRSAYLTDMPAWLVEAGTDLIHHEGAARVLRHPDPEVGPSSCRLVEETPRALRDRGLTRITLVLAGVTSAADPRSSGVYASVVGA